MKTIDWDTMLLIKIARHVEMLLLSVICIRVPEFITTWYLLSSSLCIQHGYFDLGLSRPNSRDR